MEAQATPSPPTQVRLSQARPSPILPIPKPPSPGIPISLLIQPSAMPHRSQEVHSSHHRRPVPEQKSLHTLSSSPPFPQAPSTTSPSNHSITVTSPSIPTEEPSINSSLPQIRKHLPSPLSR